jgi:hypothetical protein
MPVSSAAAVGSGRSTSMSLAFCSPAPPTSPYQRSNQPNTLWNREANLVLLQPLALSLVRLHRPMLARDSLDPACNATRIHPGEAVPAPSFSRRLPGLGDLMRAGLTLRSRGGGSSERADPGSETMSESSRGEGLRPRSDILRNPSSNVGALRSKPDDLDAALDLQTAGGQSRTAAVGCRGDCNARRDLAFACQRLGPSRGHEHACCCRGNECHTERGTDHKEMGVVLKV